MVQHRFSFVRAGGFDQPHLRTGADLVALSELDQKLWVALACPTRGVEFDHKTLQILDTDGDERIRATELLSAIAWIDSVLVDAEDLVEGKSSIGLDRIDTREPEGALLKKTARAVLDSLGKESAKEISVDDMTKALEALGKRKFNGDGVLPAASAGDDAAKQVILDALACTAPAEDRGGEKGVTETTVKEFFAEIDAHVGWLDGVDAAAMPLGDRTGAAWKAYDAVRAKVDDYFARARLAAFDPRALVAVNRDEKEYVALAAKDISIAELAGFPLAQVAADRALPLGTGVNPAWVDRVGALRDAVVDPLLGERTELTETEWATIGAKLAPHGAWLGAKKGASVEKLGADRVRALAKGTARKDLEALLAEENAQKPVADAIASVEKLVRYHRDLFELANNFVSFRDFYARTRPSIFQIGTLYLDQRACELCVRVNDAGKHAMMAPLSNTYLVYCDCTRKGEDKMTIAAAMTAGDVDNLMVGRNGVFYDRKGRDWDATVTKIVDQPISIRQAFWAPYKKGLRLLEEQIAKRAAEADTHANTRVTGAVTHVDTAVVAGSPAAAAPAAAPAPEPAKLDIGVVAAIGVAVGGLTAALGAMLNAFFGLGMFMPLGVLGLIMAISGPSMAVAFLKLRRRNLGPILDANGWAVNAQALLNVPLGGSLTRLAVLPPGSTRDLRDPFEEKRRPWKLYLALALVLGTALGWYLGKLDGFLPPEGKSTTVLGVHAPSYDPAAAAAADTPAPAAAPAP